MKLSSTRITMSHYNHPNHMMQIDNFVRSVFRPNISLAFIQDEIGRLSPHLYIPLLAELQYSAAIMIYVECLQQLVQLGISSVYQMTDNLLFAFRNYVLSQQDRIMVEDHRFGRQENRNRSSLERYLKQLLNHYARLLFIRIDLSIKQEFQHEVGISQFREWIRIMANRFSNRDGCFSDLQGYAWAIEQGVDKGFHCHTLLIYDGSKHQNDFGLGLQVAQYWQQLTQGKGCCFLSNDPNYKRQFEIQETLGIGMIHRNNQAEVSNAINTALYLVNPEKDYQSLRLRIPSMKTFGTGKFEVSRRRGL